MRLGEGEEIREEITARSMLVVCSQMLCEVVRSGELLLAELARERSHVRVDASDVSFQVFRSPECLWTRVTSERFLLLLVTGTLWLY